MDDFNNEMPQQTPPVTPNGSEMPQQTPPPVSPMDNGKGMCIAALVLGIAAIVLAWFYLVNIIALAAAVVGLICAVQGRKKVGPADAGLAMAGLVLSIIGLAMAGIGFLTCTVCISCAACGAESALDSALGAWNM